MRLKYRVIERLRNVYPVVALCRILEVLRSTYNRADDLCSAGTLIFLISPMMASFTPAPMAPEAKPAPVIWLMMPLLFSCSDYQHISGFLLLYFYAIILFFGR